MPQCKKRARSPTKNLGPAPVRNLKTLSLSPHTHSAPTDFFP
ncbi:hypothetical protein SF83666_c25000 [Sinorhizobium fredii CCBAU 83666]|nr:hypothetical protein SF83666_c25000 [Sinorhizobium fredii CCBAU 83666]